MEQNKKEKSKIIFPENTSEIISRLVKKYRLEEPGETILDRLKKNKKITGYEIVKLLREIKDGKINEKDLTLELQKRLNISEKKLEDITKEIKESFFATEEKEILITQQAQLKKAPKKDIYREPTE